MPYFDLPDTQIYYEDQGQGRPIVFLHGVWMSSRFFAGQLPYFGERHRVIAPDFRGHGRSSHVHRGHTLEQYARDVRALIEGLGLEDVVLVGWSMGAFVLWDYIRQFGVENIKANVVVSESASHYQWPDWPNGIADFAGLCGMLHDVQTDRAAFVREFIPLMFMDEPSPEATQWMFDEITRLPESIASAILFDQTVQDYRGMLSQVTIPSLLCFGRDEKLIPIVGGYHLLHNLPDARMVMFEASGHCPFLEEPAKFNDEVQRFLQSLP